MAETGGNNDGKGGSSPKLPSVEVMLRNLNLTEEEGAIMDFVDDDEEEALAPVEWALVGKILSPSTVSVDSIRSAMKPAWGNPCELKIYSIG